MSISSELSQRFENPQFRDGAMLEIARHLIVEPGINTLEVIKLFAGVPFLNSLERGGIERVLDRIRFSNQLLPSLAAIFSAPEIGIKLNLGTCHQALMIAETLATEMNTPTRETIAAMARLGVQVAVGQILSGEQPREKIAAKTNLIYFSSIEMLALGVKTGAYQFCHVLPENASPPMFASRDTIRPIIMVKPGEDEKMFKGSVAFGQTPIEQVVVPVAGDEYYYIADEGLSSDPQSS